LQSDLERSTGDRVLASLNRVVSPIKKMTHLGMGCWRGSPKQKSTGRRFGSAIGGKASQIGRIK
jgi:hypothetical protein